MAKSEPNIPDDVKITLENEQTAQVAEATAQEMTAEEAVLHDTGDDGLGPHAPFDYPAPHPAPGDVVVPFDKINEII